jgi:hypothetical protein
MTKTEKRLQKNSFMENIYPYINRDYETIRYEHFIKIKIDNRWIDYYPGAEKINVLGTTLIDNKWHDMKIDELLKRLKIEK